MARKDIIRMSVKELSRIKTIHSVLEVEITQKKAADILNLLVSIIIFPSSLLHKP